jgi:hypothetical protein
MTGEDMPSPQDGPSRDVSSPIGVDLPPGRLAELQPRLQALLADFAYLQELEAADLEPLPALVVTPAAGDQDE